MIWYQGPSLAETLRKINAWFPKKHFPLLLGASVPAGVLEFEEGIWRLHGLVIAEVGPGISPQWPWLKRGDLVAQTNSKDTFVDTLTWWWSKYVDGAAESSYLTQIGYNPDEKWLEFSAMIPANQHLALGDLAMMLRYLQSGTAQGQNVDTVRVTFHSRVAARRELPWLVHLGLTAQYLGEDGTWQVLGPEGLAEPAHMDSSYSSEFEPMMQAILACNGLEVEGLRDEFSARLVADAVLAYAQLTSWRQKASLVQLVQDLRTAETKPLMTDFLAAPRDDSDDEVWIAKAIALFHLTGDASFIDAGPERTEEAARTYLAQRR